MSGWIKLRKLVRSRLGQQSNYCSELGIVVVVQNVVVTFVVVQNVILFVTGHSTKNVIVGGFLV